LKNILITGSTGFIGRRLVNAVDGNIKILAREKHSKFETFICDFEKDSIPENTLIDIDTVFHLAGFAHDMRNDEDIKDLYQRVNVKATIDLAELAVKSGVKAFVFVSSVKAGGVSVEGKCSTEIDQLEPEGVYGKTKRESEQKLLKIGKESGMHVSIVRPSLVYGPGVKGNLKLMFKGINKGWFPPLPQTGNKRSMIHVDDVVSAILLVAKNKRANGEVYIATDGMPHSSSEIYETMSLVAGKKIKNWRVSKIVFDCAALLSPRIKYKIEKLLGDECYSSEKLKGLGFKPQRTLKEMHETFF
jgi:UDP-glucose 4-epimerase